MSHPLSPQSFRLVYSKGKRNIDNVSNMLKKDLPIQSTFYNLSAFIFTIYLESKPMFYVPVSIGKISICAAFSSFHNLHNQYWWLFNSSLNLLILWLDKIFSSLMLNGKLFIFAKVTKNDLSKCRTKEIQYSVRIL